MLVERKGERMMKEGTLSIVRRGTAYQVRYASNNPHGRDRQLYECADEETMRAFLQQLGAESVSINQACIELRKGGVAVLLIVLSAEQIQAFFRPSTAKATLGGSMPWYQVRLSIDDLATGKQIRLQNAFETLFLDMHTPTGAAMFGNLDVKDDYSYYFSPQCAVFFAAVLSSFGAAECAPPSRQSAVFLVGDVGAPGDVLRS
jgi:hypothetical protein